MWLKYHICIKNKHNYGPLAITLGECVAQAEPQHTGSPFLATAKVLAKTFGEPAQRFEAWQGGPQQWVDHPSVNLCCGMSFVNTSGEPCTDALGGKQPCPVQISPFLCICGITFSLIRML